MARVEGVDFVALRVRDLGVSRRLYEERLGLVLVPQGPSNAVVFRTETMPFAVREPVADLDVVERLGRGVALCESLETAGTRIVEEMFEGPFGYAVTVHDG